MGPPSVEREATVHRSRVAGEVLAQLCPHFSGQEGPVFWGARRGEPLQEAYTGTMFPLRTCRDAFSHGVPVQPALQLFPRSHPHRLPRALQTGVLPKHASRPEYIIGYILLIKTIVEAHKGKLLICVPACHSACVNKEDNRSFGKLFRELSNRYASQRILLTVIFLSVCTQK